MHPWGKVVLLSVQELLLEIVLEVLLPKKRFTLLLYQEKVSTQRVIFIPFLLRIMLAKTEQ